MIATTLRRSLLPGLLTAMLLSPAHAKDTTQTITNVTPTQAAKLFKALQSQGKKKQTRGGAGVCVEWRPDGAQVDEGGWLIHGQLRARFRAFQHRQPGTLRRIVSIFSSGSRARKVDFDYTRSVSIQYAAERGLVGVLMHDSEANAGHYNIAIEGITSTRIDLPSISVSGGPFRLQGSIQKKTFRAYATGLPYMVTPIIRLSQYGFGRKYLRVGIGLAWKSNVELEVTSIGESDDSSANIDASIDMKVNNQVVLSGAAATSSQRLTTPISVKATGEGLSAIVEFDEGATKKKAALRLAMAMDVNWELAILQHAAVTNFGSVHLEAKPGLKVRKKAEGVPSSVMRAWKAMADKGLPGGPLTSESLGAANLRLNTDTSSADGMAAIRSMYRSVKTVPKAQAPTPSNSPGARGHLPF